MSNPYASSELGFDAPDPWMQYVPWLLYFCGAMYILLGLGSGALMGAAAALIATASNTDEDTVAAAMSGVYGVIILVICLGFGAVNVVAGVGFRRGAKWAWFAAMILGAMYLMSACMPFGLGILYGAFNDRTRKAFLG